MSGVTDADREIARMVVGVWKHTGDDLAEIIAAQLAEEREKARAPFLALCDDYDEGRLWSSQVVDRIRRAAKADA